MKQIVVQKSVASQISPPCFGLRDPVSQGGILDATLSCEGRASHSALLAGGNDFSFVSRAIPDSSRAAKFARPVGPLEIRIGAWKQAVNLKNRLDWAFLVSV